MLPGEYYKSRAESYSQSAGRLQQQSDRLSVARLIAFAGGLTLFVVLSGISIIAAVAAIASSLILFAWMVIRYETTERLRKRFLRLSEINSREIRCLEGGFSSCKSGDEHIERDHPYSHDLEIFGRASLYQYICRTTSKPAGDMLAEYLKVPAMLDEILMRQEAVKELRPMTGWQQELMVNGSEYTGFGNDPDEIMQSRIHTSIRISDSLEENISSFYAELRRLRSIISGAKNDSHVFLFLDEILKGTNSDDRYSGSVALMKQLTG